MSDPSVNAGDADKLEGVRIGNERPETLRTELFPAPVGPINLNTRVNLRALATGEKYAHAITVSVSRSSSVVIT